MYVYEKLYCINNLSWIKGTKGNRETVSYRWAIYAFWGRAEDRHLGIDLWKEGTNVSAYDCSLPRMDTYRVGLFFWARVSREPRLWKFWFILSPWSCLWIKKCVGKGVKDQIIKDLLLHSTCSSFVKQALEEPWKGGNSFVLKDYTLDILFIFAFSRFCSIPIACRPTTDSENYAGVNPLCDPFRSLCLWQSKL